MSQTATARRDSGTPPTRPTAAPPAAPIPVVTGTVRGGPVGKAWDLTETAHKYWEDLYDLMGGSYTRSIYPTHILEVSCTQPATSTERPVIVARIYDHNGTPVVHAQGKQWARVKESFIEQLYEEASDAATDALVASMVNYGKGREAGQPGGTC